MSSKTIAPRVEGPFTWDELAAFRAFAQKLTVMTGTRHRVRTGECEDDPRLQWACILPYPTWKFVEPDDLDPVMTVELLPQDTTIRCNGMPFPADRYRFRLVDRRHRLITHTNDLAEALRRSVVMSKIRRDLGPARGWFCRREQAEALA